MAEVNVYYDPKGRTLAVWFGRPRAEYVCKETGEEVILMKDRRGRVIGFERLNYPELSRKHGEAGGCRVVVKVIDLPATPPKTWRRA